MMKILTTAALLCAFATSASAQQPQQTAFEQALSAKLLQEIQGGLACSTQMVSVQAELAKAQIKIKEIEAKSEEKK